MKANGLYWLITGMILLGVCTAFAAEPVKPAAQVKSTPRAVRALYFITPERRAMLRQITGRFVMPDSLGFDLAGSTCTEPDVECAFPDLQRKDGTYDRSMIAQLQALLNASLEMRRAAHAQGDGSLASSRASNVNPELADQAAPRLIALIHYPSGEVHLRAIQCLGKMVGIAREAVPALAKCLSDPDPLIGAFAWRSCDEETLKAVLAAEDLDPKVRADAERILLEHKMHPRFH